MSIYSTGTVPDRFFRRQQKSTSAPTAGIGKDVQVTNLQQLYIFKRANKYILKKKNSLSMLTSILCTVSTQKFWENKRNAGSKKCNCYDKSFSTINKTYFCGFKPQTIIVLFIGGTKRLHRPSLWGDFYYSFVFFQTINKIAVEYMKIIMKISVVLKFLI